MSTPLINLPSIGDIVATSTTNVNAMFNVLLPVVLFGLGIAVGVAFVLWLTRRISRGVKRISHH